MTHCKVCKKKLPQHAKKYCSFKCKSEMWRKLCKRCGVSFVPSEARVEFCSRHCAALTNASNPEIRAKISANRDHEKAGRAISAAILSNPKEVARRKVRGAWLAKHHGGWKSHSGIGPQEMVLRGLFPTAKPSFHVKTGLAAKLRQPNYFKIDLAWPNEKLAVEIDGDYHEMESQRAKDKFKDAFLSKHGWTVLRFKNKEVSKETDRVRMLIETMLETLKLQHA